MNTSVVTDKQVRDVLNDQIDELIVGLAKEVGVPIPKQMGEGLKSLYLAGVSTGARLSKVTPPDAVVAVCMAHSVINVAKMPKPPCAQAQR